MRLLPFLLTASLLMGTTVIIHSAGSTLLIQWWERQASGWIANRRWLGRQLVLVCTAILLMLMHLLEMLVWAIAYWNEPAIKTLKTFDDALYFSAVTYTTLGYGDILIDDAMGRLLCGLEAVNGMLLVGWSTALLFFVVQRIWEADHLPGDSKD